MSMYSMQDVVAHISERYHKAKKVITNKHKKSSLLYDAICKDVFDLYGQQFGYQQLGIFKSDINRLRKQLKKRLQGKPEVSEPFHPLETKKQVTGSAEGMGLIFTLRQIERLNLNEDTYL